MILGITGGSGCGKTTALQAAGDLGGLILDCDAVYHRLLACSPALLDAISSRFPGVVSDGRLDRKKLGRIVFFRRERPAGAQPNCPRRSQGRGPAAAARQPRSFRRHRRHRPV